MVTAVKSFLTLTVSLVCGLCVSASAEANAPYCREYTRDVIIGGVVQQSYGTACLQPDGSWQVMNADGSLGPQTVVVQETQVITPPPVVVQRSPSVYLGINTGYPYYYGSSHRHHFYHYHNGPGARQHWQHHKKVLYPNGNRGHKHHR